MASDRPTDPRREVEAQLIEKAVRDPAFRETLLRDPKAAIEREVSARTGSAVKLPAGVRIVVHEETADTFHLVVPPALRAAQELSDTELSSVAGGTDPGGVSNTSQLFSCQKSC